MPGYTFTKQPGHILRRCAGATVLALALTAGTTATQAQVSLRKPPGNVAAGDYMKLFGGAVFVGHPSRNAARADRVRSSSLHVAYLSRDGRYVRCGLDTRSLKTEPGPPRYGYRTGARWKMRQYSRGDRVLPVFVNGRDLSGSKGGHLMPVYNGRTGELTWYTHDRKRWWNLFPGHLQKRLPRAVWTLCPDFPSAKSLGDGVNEKQTSGNYFRLIRQDRGQRILRPDLVTPNPIECRNPKTGKFELCESKK